MPLTCATRWVRSSGVTCFRLRFGVWGLGFGFWGSGFEILISHVSVRGAWKGRAQRQSTFRGFGREIRRWHPHEEGFRAAAAAAHCIGRARSVRRGPHERKRPHP